MFVTIRPEDFAAGHGPYDAVLDLCTGPIAGVRGHLDHSHGALLGLALDAGVVPDPSTLRATRDIGNIQRALGDLQTLGLLDEHAHGLVLPHDVSTDLSEGLERHWRGVEVRARGKLESADEQSHTGSPEALVWLRRLLIFAAHRGLRRTDNGELHQGDVRRYEAVVELPSRRLLETCATLGVGLEVFLDLGGKLIVGPGVDVADLPSEHFQAECDHAWVEGRLSLALTQTTAAAGMFGHWSTPLERQADAEAERASSLYGTGMRAATAMTALLAPMSPDPATSVLNASNYDVRGLPAAVVAFHARARQQLLDLLASVPVGRAVATAALEELMVARMALLALEHAPRAPRKSAAPSAGLFAVGLAPLPWFHRRACEGLPAIVWALRGVHGGSVSQGDTVVFGATVTPAATAGRLTVQPNAEVLVPPDASIHALVHLSCGARPTRLDTMSTFTLDRRALMRLADAGMDVTQWGQLLEQWTGSPLPGTVAELLAEVARRHGELVMCPAGAVLIADDPVRMAELLSYPKLAREVLLRPSDTVAVLREGADLTALLEDLGDRGFSAIVKDAPD